jgi:hypothetical protein
VLAALVLLGLAGVSQPGKAQDKAAGGRTLKVKLHFTGAGTVDQKHQIVLFLFDSPDFMQRNDAMPIARENATAKDVTVTFSDVAKSPVYLIAVYDPTGAYEGMSPPPSGSSLGMYGKTPGQVEPVNIDAGKTAQIDLAFDDSFKMP